MVLKAGDCPVFLFQKEVAMKKWYPYADLILKNAKIYTVDLSIDEIRNGNYDFTVINNGFVAVKDGKIIYA